MSRIPLKSYEKTPLKNQFCHDYIFTSSHISEYITIYDLINYILFYNLCLTEKKLFTSTTYKHYKGINHNNTYTEIEETLSSNSSINIQSKTSKLVKYVHQSIDIFTKFIISYCIISISMLSETYGFIMGKI